MIQLPRIIGHRGAAAEAPENTLESFRFAAAAGIGWVEFDIRFSADHVPVVIHDETLARTAGVEARIDQTTAAEIASQSRAHPTPTLAETMALLGELGLGAIVEIKEVQARRAVSVAVVKTLEIARRNHSIPVLVQSFSRPILKIMREIADFLPRGLLLRHGTNNAIGLARRLDCVLIHANHRQLISRQVAEWKAAGFLVACYVVNDPARARLLFDWGVDSVISSAPGALAEAVDQSR